MRTAAQGNFAMHAAGASEYEEQRAFLTLELSTRGIYARE